MASPMNDIGEIVKKAKVLLLDIEGTTTSISFVTDELFPYALKHVEKFLADGWETDAVREAVAGLRRLAEEDGAAGAGGAVKIPAEDTPKEEQISALVASVTWLMSSDRKVGALKQLQGLVWQQGYESGHVKGHVYDDVPPALRQWRSGEGRRVYIYSSGSVQAQKLLFGQSLAGDLLPLIDGHFDTAVGAKQEEGSYRKIVEQIGCKSDEVLFLTDILKEATAAAAAGLHAALVSRPGNAPLPGDVTHPVLHSLADLAPTKKRKPDAQEEVPAKIPKTDAPETVATTSTEETTSTAQTTATTEPEEKMEVEADTHDKTDEPKEGEKKAVVAETNKEITDSSKAPEAASVTTEPIVTEEKADTKTEETETMDTAEPVTVENGVGKDPAPVAEETPPAVVTEIEEVTDKQTLEEVADIIEDIVPVVEEPKSVESDMADLQNVGEVLDRECDEILSKVQDVTNLDSIAVKPMLHPIAEETMDTDNTDTNDIVDRILDSEQELEMKSSEAAAKEPVVEEKTAEVKNGEANEVSSTKPEEASSTDNEKMATNGEETSPAVESSEAENANDKIEEPEKETETKPEPIPAETKPEPIPAETKPETTPVTKPETTPVTKPETTPVTKPETTLVTEPETTPVTNPETSPVTKPETSPVTKPETSPVTKPETSPVTKPETSPVTKPETSPVTKPETSPVTKPETSPVTKPETTPVTKPETTPETNPEEAAEEKTESKEEPKTEEPQTNGTTNGIGKEEMNGDSSEELSSRLAAENGKDAENGTNGSNGTGANGSNGKSNGDAEVGAGDAGPDVEIKVKSVAEARPDTIEPTQA